VAQSSVSFRCHPDTGAQYEPLGYMCANPHISQMFGRDDMMNARLHTAPMLMSTPAFDSVSQARKSVETSLDAADTSVRATSVGGL